MVDFLALTSSDQLLFILKLYISFYKTTYLNKELNCTEPFPSVRERIEFKTCGAAIFHLPASFLKAYF